MNVVILRLLGQRFVLARVSLLAVSVIVFAITSVLRSTTRMCNSSGIS